MNNHVDRALVEALLEDGSFSYREIARRAGCSDWAVRQSARELAGDDRSMKNPSRSRDDGCDEPLGFGGWAVFVGVCAAFAGLVWRAARRPPEGGPTP